MRKLSDLFSEAYKTLVDQYDIQIERAHEGLEHEENSHLETKDELSRSQGKVEELNQKLQKAEEENTKLKELLQSANVRFRAQIGEKDQLSVALETRIKEKNQFIEALQTQVKESNHSMDALQKQVDEKNQSIEGFRTQAEEKEKSIAELEVKEFEARNESARMQEQHLSTINELKVWHGKLEMQTDGNQRGRSAAEAKYFIDIYRKTFVDLNAIRGDLKVVVAKHSEVEASHLKTIGGIKILSNVPYSKTEEARTKLMRYANTTKDLLKEESCMVSQFLGLALSLQPSSYGIYSETFHN